MCRAQVHVHVLYLRYVDVLCPCAHCRCGFFGSVAVRWERERDTESTDVDRDNSCLSLFPPLVPSFRLSLLPFQPSRQEVVCSVQCRHVPLAHIPVRGSWYIGTVRAAMLLTRSLTVTLHTYQPTYIWITYVHPLWIWRIRPYLFAMST